MTRSTRFNEAREALEAFRSSMSPMDDTPDLFSKPMSDASDRPLSDRWKAEALALIETVARSRSEFTVEDIDFEPAIDNRARGAAMQTAAKRGWLKPLGWVSGDKGRHGRPVRLWASRIYEGGTDHAA